MATKAEIKLRAQHIKLKVRQGDRVKIVAGKDRGQLGVIAMVLPKRQRVVVVQESTENPGQFDPLNAAIKHRKAKYQGERSARVRIPVPIHISNVMVLDPDTDEPTRIGRRVEDGKIVRYSKKTGKTIVDKPNLDKKD